MSVLYTKVHTLMYHYPTKRVEEVKGVRCARREPNRLFISGNVYEHVSKSLKSVWSATGKEGGGYISCLDTHVPHRIIWYGWDILIKVQPGTSLVVQWLRTHLAMQETCVQSVIRELRSHILQSDLAHTPQLERHAQQQNIPHAAVRTHTPQGRAEVAT